MVEKADLNAGLIASPSNAPPKSKGKESEAEMIIRWFGDAKAWRSQFDCNWEKYLNAYKGQTWNQTSSKTTGFIQKSSGSKQKPENNIIRSTIQSIIPILTDAKPGFNLVPPQPLDHEFTKMLGEQIESIWDRQDMPVKIVEAITDQSIFDCGIFKVLWNSELEDGLGDVEIEVVDPNDIFVSRGTIDFDRNCSFVVHRLYKTVGYMRRKFPKYANRIKPDTSTKEKESTYKGAVMDGTMTIVSPVNEEKNKDVKVPDLADSNKIIEVWEVWYPDSTVEQYEKELEDGSKERIVKKKYPNGHLTTLLPNQKLCVQSTRNPYEGPQWNPFVKTVDTVVPRCIYGEGQAEPLMGPQKLINKTVQQILEIMRLMANPVWIGDKTAGINWRRITNKIGLIILKNKDSDLRRDFPPGIDRSLFEVLQIFMRFADIVSGVQDVTQGRKPTGITAAEAIETLQEAAQTRLRLKERNLNQSLSKLAKLIINRILQFYRGVRYQRISGEDAEVPDFIEFNIEPVEVNGGEGLNMTRKLIKWNPESQRYEEAPEGLTEARSTKTNFDVKVSTGTSLPFQKMDKLRTAFKLIEAGAIDREELLEAAEWANKEKVLQRMREAEAVMAQQPQLPPAA